MARGVWGSSTKEFPISEIDTTMAAIYPGMAYSELLLFARTNTRRDIPGLLQNRFISVENRIVVYERFLQLFKERGSNSHFIRKIMYFVWAYRDQRLREFVLERVADSNGRWRAEQLINKSNSDFFDQWHARSTAVKTRSNIEFYLSEMGIFDPATRTVRLELTDNWLSEAAVIAAQYEPNSDERRKLINDPVGFLIAKGWNGLINLSSDELRSIELPPSEDPSPLEDDEIIVSPASTSASKPWTERPAVTSGKTSITATIDMVARERANNSHRSLEKLLADAARTQKYTSKQNAHIDLYFETPSGVCLAEIKSAHWRNYHSQLRKGVSQLLEYRFLYRSEVGTKPIMILMMEIEPQRAKAWLVEYLNELEIIVVWPDAKTKQLVTSCAIPPGLNGVIAKKS